MIFFHGTLAATGDISGRVEFDDSDATGDVSGVSESSSGTSDLESNVEEYSFDVQSTSSEKSVTAELDPLKTAKEHLLLGCDDHIFCSNPFTFKFQKTSLVAATLLSAASTRYVVQRWEYNLRLTDAQRHHLENWGYEMIRKAGLNLWKKGPNKWQTL